MTISEAENFYKQDEHKYIIKENDEILNFIKEKKKQRISIWTTIEEMQDMINKITSFFEFKYPDKFLDALKHNPECRTVKICDKTAKILDIEQLKHRLSHDQNQFLECPYGSYFNIVKPKKNLWDLNHLFIRIDNDGHIAKNELEEIQEYKFLHSIEGIDNAEDLLGRFIGSPIEVNYSELEKIIISHKTQIQLRDIILNLIPFSLIYSKNTLPEYGYIRAKSFVRMFNKEYHVNIDLHEVEEIIKNSKTNNKQKVKH